MGNNNSFYQIEKKYGQNGVDYITFRYHERKSYRRIIRLINQIKDHANLQQHQALSFIDQQKTKLESQFTQAKNQAETTKRGSIKQAEAQSKQKVQDFSGYNYELKRLDSLYQQVNLNYQNTKLEVEKNIREEIMKQQNQSKLKKIKEFDNKTDQQRKNIEKECIRVHPDKVHQVHPIDFETKYTEENYWSEFNQLFDMNKIEKQNEQGRMRVKNNILPSKTAICC